MSGFLGYDIEAVRRLRGAMRHADDLLTVCSGEPDAAEALRAARRARDVLGPWIALTDALLACTVLTDGTWRTDALDASAAALTTLAQDPAWSSMLWETFDGWQPWFDRLGAERARAVELAEHPLGRERAESLARVEAIDALVAAVASTLRAEHLANPRSDPLALVRHMEPYSAALLVPHLGLDAAALARVAFELTCRWCDRVPGISDATLGAAPFDFVADGDDAADLLFRTMLATPGAPVAYVTLAAGRPETLLAAADDTAVARDLLLAGTAPTATTTAAAGAAITSILDWFVADDRGAWLADFERQREAGHGWRPVLAELVAPWLIHLSPLDRDWPGDATSRRDAVAYVLGDPEALRSMLDSADSAADGLAADLAARRAAGAPELSIDELAAFVGMLSQLAVDEQARDAATATARWDLWWRLGGVAINAIPHPVANAGAKALADRAQGYARDHQLLGAPLPPESVRDLAGYEREWMLTTMGAAMVDVTFRAMVDAGRLPPTATPPPVPDRRSATPQLAYEQEYAAWTEATFDGASDPRSLEVDSMKSPFLNAADAGRTLAS